MHVFLLVIAAIHRLGHVGNVQPQNAEGGSGALKSHILRHQKSRGGVILEFSSGHLHLTRNSMRAGGMDLSRL